MDFDAHGYDDPRASGDDLKPILDNNLQRSASNSPAKYKVVNGL